jgi:AAA+ superfamily predicted ATPase
MTASVIAGEVHLPFYTILMDKLITKFMGETSAKLRQIFEIIQKRRGLYLFDEFDAIGAERGLDNDVGEMRRVLNAFLQFIEGDDSDSLIVAATNNLRLLDQALFRRFDDVLHYQLPKKEEAVRLINNRIGTFKGRFSIDRLIRKNIKLSHAEVAQACDDAIKEAILCDRRGVTGNSLHVMLREHQAAHRGTKGGA